MGETNPPEGSNETKKMNGDAQAPNGTPMPTKPESTETKLSGAELKKRAKAEKAARRAKEKEAAPKPVSNVQESNALTATQSTSSAKGQRSKSGPQDTKQRQALQSKQPPDGKGTQNRRGSAAAYNEKQLPVRRRGSQSAPQESKEDLKQVSFVSHLYGQPKRHMLDGVGKDIHPAILALGLQISSYIVCGSSARCVATLLALKSVIESYTTPPGNALSRHLTSHHLSPQLSYLKSCRPFSVSQSNAIRWLKDVIIKIDPAVPEDVAKSDLCSAIDTFIRERITVADKVIAEAAADRVADGDVVLVFAKSYVVQQALLAAFYRGTKFRVVVVDSRPLFEGKSLVESLAVAGLEVQYCLMTALAHAVKGVTKCVLGAHAMLGNGRLYSRAGTGLVAMMAKEQGSPVIVCAESIKFTDRVALDSIVGNELAPEEELLDDDLLVGEGLKNWRKKENLHLLNVLYDVTPVEFLDLVVTELGSLPPTSAPVIHRISTNS